jgi:hypothetical protein
LDLIRQYNEKYKPKGLVWRVAENFEAEPGFLAAAKAIRDGKIGDVNFFKAAAVNYVNKDSKWYKTPWRTVPDVSRRSSLLKPEPGLTCSFFSSSIKEASWYVR